MLTNVLSLIMNIVSIVKSWFVMKEKTVVNDTIKEIHLEEEEIKNEITKELNNNYPNTNRINRLYHRLRKLQERKTEQ